MAKKQPRGKAGKSAPGKKAKKKAGKAPSGAARKPAYKAKLPGLIQLTKTPPRLARLEPAEVDPAERDRAREVVQRLERQYPDARVMLKHEDPWQLLVATILAAQCTDAKVNEITPGLFERFPTPEAMSRADLRALERMVRPTGFFRNKSKSIRNASRAILECFGGEVPRTMAEMLSLPGVARKTANVVLSNALGVNSGVVVDTHNVRLSNRLGFVDTTDAVRIERFWLAAARKQDWPLVGHLLYCHGQQVCGRKPRCPDCVINGLCPSAEPG